MSNKYIGIDVRKAGFISDEGKPYHCAIKDLYTIRKPDDKACWEFTLPKEKK